MSKPSDTSISGKDVLAFLADNPDFLIKHGNADWLFPHKASGQGGVIDLGHVITKRAQDALRRTSSVKANMVDITTANHEIQQRIHHLALLIVAATSADEIARLVQETMPAVLDVAAATLVMGDHLPLHLHPNVVSFDKGFLPKLTGGVQFSLGVPFGLQAEVFRNILPEPPKSVAFAFLPVILDGQDHEIVLAIAGHDKDSFTEGHGTDFLEFIASMIAVALLARTGETPPDAKG